jgi:NAD(P)-dependent dehydrogenase (short-subunit alcohol dehydrogenase family)
MPDRPKNLSVLVTGASTGIGHACALRLANNGFHVFASVRSEADAKSLEHDASRDAHPIHPVLMDVTDPASISAAASQIQAAVGEEGLFALVNNAGVCVVGPAECVSLEDWKRQFDVNVFGLMAVTQAMLPLLRLHHQRHAPSWPRVVNISSVTGAVATPLFGAYSASKAAVESLSDTLRRELFNHHIRVSLIIPGTIQSEIWRKEKDGVAAIRKQPDCRGLYGRMIDHVARYVFKAADGAKPADHVAAAVERCLTRAVPPIRTLVAWEAHIGVAASRFLPDRLLDYLMSKTFRLTREPSET